MRLPKQAFSAIFSVVTALSGLISNDVLASMRAESGDVDLYVLGLYEGHSHKNGKVKVVVSVTNHPIALLMSAYEAVDWQIELAKGARLDRVYLSGYHEQHVTGLQAGTQVFATSYEQGSQFFLYGYDSGRCSNLVGRVQNVLGLKATQHLCQYRGSAFLVDQSGIHAISGTDGFSGGDALKSQERVKLPRRTRQAVVYPISSGAGSINPGILEKYRTIAVPNLIVAPGFPQSGEIAAGMLTNQLLQRGFTVVERSKLDQLTEEQRLQLMRGEDSRDSIKIGQLTGAKAVVLGEVTQWTTAQGIDLQGQPYDGSLVSISLRLVDVETAEVLFSGEGHFVNPSTSSPQGAAQLILGAIVTRLAVQVGLVSTGRTGFKWGLQQKSGSSVLVVTEFDSDSPAYDAGIRSGDKVLSCNGAGGQTWKTQWDAMRSCEVDAGQILSLEVLRGSQHLRIDVKADNRFKGSLGSSHNSP
jgi:hypothetical protein